MTCGKKFTRRPHARNFAPDTGKGWASILRGGWLIALGVMMPGPAVLARITQTIPPPSETFDPLLQLTLGGSVEYETDRTKSQYNFPLLIEYNFSEYLKLTLQPSVGYIQGRQPGVRTIGGLGDLETSVEYEFLRERRYRPALTAQGLIRWHTSSDPDLGRPGPDIGIGLIASKNLVFADVDLTLLFTRSGDREQGDTLELVLATEVPLGRRFYAIAEVVETFELSGKNRNHIEGTLGLGWHLTERLKLETGVLLRDDGTWQAQLSWEWSFSGK